MDTNEHEISFEKLVGAIKLAHEELAAQAGRAVNMSLTLRNWFIGCYIAEYELRGSDRAQYGAKLLADLAKRLTKLAVSNSNRRQLYRYLRLYRLYPEIVGTLPAQLKTLLPAGTKALEIVGILLCTQHDKTLVEYALAGMDNGLFVSRYQLELPKREEIQRFIDEQMRDSK
ncbi:MAG: DUF1016 family protein [Bacteroidetes bacterium]|nr:DUF1016 family protein [Bacteroidota bacterium]